MLKVIALCISYLKDTIKKLSEQNTFTVRNLDVIFHIFVRLRFQGIDHCYLWMNVHCTAPYRTLHMGFHFLKLVLLL